MWSDYPINIKYLNMLYEDVPILNDVENIWMVFEVNIKGNLTLNIFAESGYIQHISSYLEKM